MIDLSRIFCHRGIWSEKAPANSSSAIFDALLSGFSLETDLVVSGGRVVISHDPVEDDFEGPTLDELRRFVADNEIHGYLALNVKADNLFKFLGPSRPGEFFFDMSAPQAVAFSRVGLPIALRLSELEPEIIPVGLQHDWVWVDSFVDDWYVDDHEVFDRHLNKRLVLVSPELHGRDHWNSWRFLKEVWDTIPEVCICTDYPFDFVRFLES